MTQLKFNLGQSAALRAMSLDRLFEGRAAEDLLRIAVQDIFPGKVALVSSFGAESAVLLAMLAEIDPTTPVLFLDTEMLFPETLDYQRRLSEILGLEDLRVLRPEAGELADEDPDGKLYQRDADGCCDLRKTRPLERALDGFHAWISGRKRFQSAERADLRLFEADAVGRLKLNPLAGWSAEDLQRFRRARGLPPHPLVTQGYPSIGCAPCTSKAFGADSRAGRWRGLEKTECGIHNRPKDGPRKGERQ